MHLPSNLVLLWTIAIFLIHVAVAARAVLRPNREPASRIAWVVVILVFPLIGIVIYLLLGETNIGKKRVARMRQVLEAMPDNPTIGPDKAPLTKPGESERFEHLFNVGTTVNGFAPLGGNTAQLLENSNTSIDSMVKDIDAALEHVHLIFYIWLSDNNGLKIVNALKRAAARGVTCRAMADGLGSRAIINSEHWKNMNDSGVKLAIALPLGNPLLMTLKGRIDLRNHRKILVIDNKVTYCGSQNCADPEFRVKAKYAPWVDIMARFEGPIVWQNQHLFASDWMAHVDEDIRYLLDTTPPAAKAGFTAQVIGTGPTVRFSAMPEVFETLMYAARNELVITTPYFVPKESMHSALCACARRGISTTIVFPARNDSFVVAAASHSYYAELLAAGVKVLEYKGGLLHAKTLTLDNEITLIGSANMDRRSFELNYENNILLHDPAFTAAVRKRQDSYIDNCQEVDSNQIGQWPLHRRLLNNIVAMFGPVL